MTPSTKAQELIKCFEALRLERYICSAGYATIGYGHKLLACENLEQISQQKAQELLCQDIARAAFGVERNICLELNQNQFDALVSFTYNVGVAALQRSTLRQKINAAELDQVGIEMMKWVHAKARIIRGLVSRRRAEIALFYDLA